MRAIMLFMKRKSIAQGLMRKLCDAPEVHVDYEPVYACADKAISATGTTVALVEVAEAGEYDVFYCLTLCRRLRDQTPACKLLLMCPEQDKACVKKAVQAKKEGMIDDFVFYDATTEYLASKLLSL